MSDPILLLAGVVVAYCLGRWRGARYVLRRQFRAALERQNALLAQQQAARRVR